MSFADTSSDVGDFLVEPLSVPSWFITTVAFVVLPALAIRLVVKRRWKILIWSVVAILAG